MNGKDLKGSGVDLNRSNAQILTRTDKAIQDG
jgi:hypothetical protein